MKDASAATRAANAAARTGLDFSDREDFEFAARGRIESARDLVVTDAEGKTVWDLRCYAFLDGDSPDTVNPSLWRNALLNLHCGLFEVTPGIYQVRGFDISNISFIETSDGVVVVDPLISTEVARAALELYFRHRPKRPVIAVIYTHSHADHFGGVRGVVDEAEVRAGRVQIIAPEGFIKHAISENLFAGVAMGRRAGYMYGNLLPRCACGQLDAGIGKATSTGTLSLIAPTRTITRTGEEVEIGDVTFVFQLTPDTEAPAEMNFHLPQLRTLHLAENANASLHNFYTLRGAQVRDASAWAHYLREALRLFGEHSEVMFTGHFWPRWGGAHIARYITRHADAYRYIHDQTLRLANHGRSMNEIAEELALPETLAREWYNRGYYGTVSHNAKAVYQKYLGWFDANPAHLNPLPPEDAAKKYVEYMGGADAVIARAERHLAQGEYRWVAEVLSHVVFADSGNQRARELAADAMEQLGYQAESAIWRNFYLTGAMELRAGIRKRPGARGFAPDVARSMSLAMFFDFLAVRLNGPKAAGRPITLNFEFSDSGERCTLRVRNGVLDYTAGEQAADADASVRLPRALLPAIALGRADVKERLAAGEMSISGEPKKFAELFTLFDSFEPWFEIIAP